MKDDFFLGGYILTNWEIECKTERREGAGVTAQAIPGLANIVPLPRE